jgi:S1-C subfamily serine protease
MRHPVYRRNCAGLTAFLAALAAGAAEAAPSRWLVDELSPFAVHVDHTPKQSWPGYGVYLGNGYVLTAAHVVGRARETRPRVTVDERAYDVDVIKEGTFETIDLTLLRVDPGELPGRLQLRKLSLCPNPPAPGEPVVTLIPEGLAASRVLDPRQLPPDIRQRFPTDIADVETTGNSGSGVFDARSGCLMGVISRKIETVRRDASGPGATRTAIAKYFVPAAAIRAFLPPQVRF